MLVMNNDLIKWTKRDYQRLQRATRNYNRLVRLERKKRYFTSGQLPMTKKYQELKSNILTREQLNQTINSLNNIINKNALDEVKLRSGELITRWQQNEINSRIGKALATQEERMQEAELIKNKIERDDEIKNIKATIKTLKDYDKKKGSELAYAIARIERLGDIDYTLKRSYQFQDNWLRSFQANFSGFDNYYLLKNKLKEFDNNPKEFYRYIRQSDFLMDVFNLYDSKVGEATRKGIKTKGTQKGTFGEYGDNEEAFNDTLKELGLL